MNGLKTNTLLAALLTLTAGSVHRLRRPCAISASHNASSVLALAFLGFFLLSGQARALLINGDFETGNLNGWTTFITNSGNCKILCR